MHTEAIKGLLSAQGLSLAQNEGVHHHRGGDGSHTPRAGEGHPDTIPEIGQLLLE